MGYGGDSKGGGFGGSSKGYSSGGKSKGYFSGGSKSSKSKGIFFLQINLKLYSTGH